MQACSPAPGPGKEVGARVPGSKPPIVCKPAAQRQGQASRLEPGCQDPTTNGNSVWLSFYARWAVVSEAGSVTSRITATGKKESLATLKELSQVNTVLLQELDQQIMGQWYNKPPVELAHLVAGTRPAKVEEVSKLAAEARKPVQEYLSLPCVSFYMKLQEGTRRSGTQAGGEAYPEGWPRVDRTQEDEEIKQRRTKIKQDLLSLVLGALGEQAPGPALHAKQLGWDTLPCKGPGVLCSYLVKRLSMLQDVINSPVTKDFEKGNSVIKAEIRNKYLTTLWSPKQGVPVALKNLIDAVWPLVQDFDWVKDCDISYKSEVDWLHQQQHQGGQ